MQHPDTTHHYSNERERIQSIDHETLVDMFLALDTKFQQLADYVRDIVTQKYGSKNERFASPGQLLLFPGTSAETQATSQNSNPKKPNKPKKPGHTRNPMPAHLDRVPIVAPTPPLSELPCPCCRTIRVPSSTVSH